MEYVSKITIFGLKMIVKSGLEKFILESSIRKIIFLLHTNEDLCPKIQCDSVTKMTWCAHGWIKKTKIVAYVHMIIDTLSQKFYPYSISTG